ncbi:hypothetical protein [Barnesiella intestinihominis]|uniref:hypothetical protein n=1 Tax=Barnesiella intestinihominis TaxID=487174 RepID=UPI003967AC35
MAAAVLIVMAVSVTSVFATGCTDPEPEARDVTIELVNPYTGEAIKPYDMEEISMPPAGTPLEYRVRDAETGEILTDDDIPENTVEGSCSLQLERIHDYSDNTNVSDKSHWPQERGKYSLLIYFDCRPRNPENPREFKRKYHITSQDILFVIV